MFAQNQSPGPGPGSDRSSLSIVNGISNNLEWEKRKYCCEEISSEIQTLERIIRAMPVVWKVNPNWNASSSSRLLFEEELRNTMRQSVTSTIRYIFESLIGNLQSYQMKDIKDILDYTKEAVTWSKRYFFLLFIWFYYLFLIDPLFIYRSFIPYQTFFIVSFFFSLMVKL